MQNFLKVKYHYRLNYKKNSNILAEDYRVIYFNTQKNANSTIKAQFVEVLGISKTENFPKDIHYQYDFPSATQIEIGTKYQNFLKFSVLRNPWERLYSCYKNKIEQSSNTGPDYILDCSPDFRIGMSFEEFVEVVCSIPDSEADYHFCSQIYLMLYPDGVFPMNYLCNIEKLDVHLEEIKSKTGIPFISSVRINSSKKSSYEAAYSKQLIEKVRKRYQIDIEFFKYEFAKKNENFGFGEVSKTWKKSIEEHPLMISILKEKNRELMEEVKHSNAPLINNLKKVKKDLGRLQQKHDEIKNSLTWKITAPLRSFRK
jgi:hypothetical protein